MKKLKTKMQTVIYEDKEYQYPDMQDANDALPLEDGAWLCVHGGPRHHARPQRILDLEQRQPLRRQLAPRGERGRLLDVGRLDELVVVEEARRQRQQRAVRAGEEVGVSSSSLRPSGSKAAGRQEGATKGGKAKPCPAEAARRREQSLRAKAGASDPEGASRASRSERKPAPPVKAEARVRRHPCLIWS